MKIVRLLHLLTLFAACGAAVAAPPEACSLLTTEEINAIASPKVEKVQPRKSGNPSECGFLDARRGSVLVVSVQEVQYAVKDEMGHERENLEKIYRAKSKPIDTIGDGGFWLGANKQLVFRKKKFIVSIIFSTPKNQNEIDTAQLARLVESRL
ncbi:MAG: hypothetical protein ACXWAC_02930 [Usitatibacter sp.]